MEKTVLYTSEVGVTKTSAADYAARATQKIAIIDEQLNGTSFINREIGSIMSDKSRISELGYNDDTVKSLESLILDKILYQNVISYFREATKQLSAYQEESLSVSFDEWVEKNGKVLPKRPKPVDLEDVPTPDPIMFEDALSTLNIKEQNAYWSAVNKAAAYGQFIHVDKPFDYARKQLNKCIAKPYVERGVGSETIVTHFVPSCQVSTVEEVFDNLMNNYRLAEKEVNKRKSDIEKILKQMRLDAQAEYRKQLNAANEKFQEESTKEEAEIKAYWAAMNALKSEYADFLTAEHERVSKLKIIVPDALKPVLEKLGK